MSTEEDIKPKSEMLARAQVLARAYGASGHLVGATWPTFGGVTLSSIPHPEPITLKGKINSLVPSDLKVTKYGPGHRLELNKRYLGSLAENITQEELKVVAAYVMSRIDEL